MERICIIGEECPYKTDYKQLSSNLGLDGKNNRMSYSEVELRLKLIKLLYENKYNYYKDNTGMLEYTMYNNKNDIIKLEIDNFNEYFKNFNSILNYYARTYYN